MRGKFNCGLCECEAPNETGLPRWEITDNAGNVIYSGDKCPRMEIAGDYASAYLFRLWEAWKRHGILPNGGGYEEQEHRYIAAFDLLDAEMAGVENAA